MDKCQKAVGKDEEEEEESLLELLFLICTGNMPDDWPQFVSSFVVNIIIFINKQVKFIKHMLRNKVC